jgi:hypothetical protein
MAVISEEGIKKLQQFEMMLAYFKTHPPVLKLLFLVL